MRASIFALTLLACSAPAFAEMKTEAVEWQVGKERFSGYIVHDDSGDAKRPGLVMFPNWMGVTDLALARAKEIAGDDYVVLVADVYGKGQRPKDAKEAGAMVGKAYDDGGIMAFVDQTNVGGAVGYIRADLSAAREAAAAQAMREAAKKIAAAAGLELKNEHGRDEGISWGYVTMVRISALPLPDTAALDRLIAERVREAVEAEREACAKIVREEERRAKWDAQHQGHDTATRAKASAAWSSLGVAAQMVEERARASKEGRDG